MSVVATKSPTAQIKADPENNSWLDGIISKLQGIAGSTTQHIGQLMTMDDIMIIISYANKLLMEDGALVEVEVPIKVVGDIHGQFDDMQKLFEIIGRVPEQKMLFLGDYVDRGSQSLETIVYLLALKLRYKDRIFLLRGNHETPSVNRIYGFYAECAAKIGVGIWWEFQTLFNRLPMAGLISKRILCMHGGLSPEIVSLDQIRNIVRPVEPTDRGMLIDLVWSDPTNKGEGWFYSPRGISYAFGKGVLAAACKMLKIDLVIRAHEVVQDGYEIMVGRMLITVFSAPNYAGQFNNAGAVVCLDEDLQITFQQLRVPPPAGSRPRPCPEVACEPGKPLENPPKLKPPSKKEKKSEGTTESTDVKVVAEEKNDEKDNNDSKKDEERKAERTDDVKEEYKEKESEEQTKGDNQLRKEYGGPKKEDEKVKKEGEERKEEGEESKKGSEEPKKKEDKNVDDACK
ncbi:hypothetical protein AB6A40_008774 [Gnathostoma spinigerum]|uniref:Serine/threonine-protein phosphatase n=1 Tax=Gnathostoma spinigerum TaxID=75299 RepID=A0ABD6F0A0_9BILA